MLRVKNLFAGFIGYARDVYEMVTSVKIEDSDDDQLFYTKIFLNPSYNVRKYILNCVYYYNTSNFTNVLMPISAGNIKMYVIIIIL